MRQLARSPTGPGLQWCAAEAAGSAESPTGCWRNFVARRTVHSAGPWENLLLEIIVIVFSSYLYVEHWCGGSARPGEEGGCCVMACSGGEAHFNIRARLRLDGEQGWLGLCDRHCVHLGFGGSGIVSSLEFKKMLRRSKLVILSEKDTYLRYHHALPLNTGLLQSPGAPVPLLVEAVAALAAVLSLVSVEAASAVAAPCPPPLLVIRVHDGGHRGVGLDLWRTRGLRLGLEDNLATDNICTEHGRGGRGKRGDLLLVQLDLLLGLLGLGGRMDLGVLGQGRGGHRGHGRQGRGLANADPGVCYTQPVPLISKAR